MNDYYCPLPFRHVFVEPRGVKPCCSYTQVFSGNVSQWINSSKLYQLQQDIRHNRINAGCKSCIANEQNDGHSTRLGSMKEYPNKVKDTKIDYVDYRSKNICNFKCRSCEPYFSHGIAQEVRDNPNLKQFYQVPPNKVAAVEDSEWILKNIRQIRRLMFTGGEPTCIPEVRTILDYIVSNQVDIEILIISNGSFTDPYWQDITAKIPKINWTISLDAVGAATEIIRHGTIWNVVSSNVRWLFAHSPSVNISTVVSNLNIMQLGDLFVFINQLSQEYRHLPNGRTQFIEICNWPKHLTPYNWPSDLKTDILSYLHSIDSNTLRPRQHEVIESLILNISNTEFNPEQWAQSNKLNTILDTLRNQQHQILWQKKS